MKISTLVFLLFFSVPSMGFQQGTANFNINSLVTDLKGEPLPASKGLNVEGSPFYLSEWISGNLTLTNNKKYIGIPIKLNLNTDEVYYQLVETKVERIASSGIISEVEFIDPEKNEMVKFRCGFPSVNENDSKTFYQILADGKITLLKQMKKILVEEKPFNSASINRRYDTAKGYYAFVNNSMTKVKRSKSGLLELMADQEEKVKNFISDNKLILKDDADLAKVIVYYNTLQ